MQEPSFKASGIDALQQHVLRTLLYYDIFDYPLTEEEVFLFLGANSISPRDVVHALHDLSQQRHVYADEGFYAVRSIEALVARRKKGNALATQLLPKAQQQARLISRFPFVRGVLASGSMSKGYMEESSDIDFFIITQPGRLWITRTLLVMYKRLFLGNSHKYFCVNYFVSEDHLEIDDQNIFTATELATILPLYGRTQYEQLIRRNHWLYTWFPNFKPRDCAHLDSGRATGFKLFWEQVINFMLVRQLEQFCMIITRRRWKRLYAKAYAATDFDVAFRSTTYASKNHPQHFQRKVVTLYREKVLSHHLEYSVPADQGHNNTFTSDLLH